MCIRDSTYAELAELLPAYCKENGFTHIELMPLAEHPFDGSWGYQITGFYAPTSRYGTPQQLAEFVNACHKEGIGVILDFVPVHFAIDSYGLKEFDGTPLYEYPAAAVGQSEWGSCNFMHSRGEIRCFIQSCADYWLQVFHADGLRMDAVSRLIYWQGDESRGVNDTAIDFLKAFNLGLKQRHPTAMLIAEDSTNFPGVTKPVDQGGLGFDYKWDLGWMNDTLDYFRTPPWERCNHYHKLTFSMAYFYNELFLLPFSHDENVHGKATIIQKMYGDYEEKFMQCRALYMYMYTHPGKKLNFMGNEFGQFREWDENREQDWEILHYPIHDAFHKYIKQISGIYCSRKALHCGEYNMKTFNWLVADAAEKCVYIYERAFENDKIICAFNFSGIEQEISFELPEKSSLELFIHSRWDEYGGDVSKSNITINTEIKNKKNTITLKIEPLSGMLFNNIIC